MFKQMLQKSVPKYNSETGEPVLYVEFQDFLGQSYVDNPEAKKELPGHYHCPDRKNSRDPDAGGR